MKKDGKGMTATTRHRPQRLLSTTAKLQTESGNLYVTVSTEEDGEPFEVFGFLGKGGSFHRGVTELACRLVSLHLRRGTPIEEIIGQCQGIQEMQPYVNQMPDGTSVEVLGLGDGIAHILKQYLKPGGKPQESIQEEPLKECYHNDDGFCGPAEYEFEGKALCWVHREWLEWSRTFRPRVK